MPIRLEEERLLKEALPITLKPLFTFDLDSIPTVLKKVELNTLMVLLRDKQALTIKTIWLNYIAKLFLSLYDEAEEQGDKATVEKLKLIYNEAGSKPNIKDIQKIRRTLGNLNSSPPSKETVHRALLELERLGIVSMREDKPNRKSLGLWHLSPLFYNEWKKRRKELINEITPDLNKSVKNRVSILDKYGEETLFFYDLHDLIISKLKQKIKRIQKN